MRGLIECGCACSRWPVVDSPRIGGKLWVGPLSRTCRCGSMLSAFTFREFRGINRRAGVVCIRIYVHARVYLSRHDCTRSCSGLSVAVERQQKWHPNIRHPRDLCTPLICVCRLQNGISVGTKADYSVAAISWLLFLIAPAISGPPRSFQPGAARSPPFSPFPSCPRHDSATPSLPPVALKLPGNYRVASLSAIVVYSLELGIFTR